VCEPSESFAEAAETRLLWGQEDALDSVLYDITRKHYAAELQALSDREEELLDRQEAIRQECKLAVELLIADGVNLERSPTPDEVERVLEDAHGILNPPRGIVTEVSMRQATQLFGPLSAFSERQPTGRPNGRPEYGENRPDLIASRLRLGVDQLWTIEELRECVGRSGPVQRTLRWRRMVLSLVIANMRGAGGHDKCAPRGIAEALKCSIRAVERLAAEGREAAWTRSP
jgi:hypothetical protein